MVMLAAPAAGAVAKAAIRRLTKKKAKVVRRRRGRLLTMSQRDELIWIARHLGRTAAAERMVHYRR